MFKFKYLNIIAKVLYAAQKEDRARIKYTKKILVSEKVLKRTLRSVFVGEISTKNLIKLPENKYKCV